MNKTDTDGSSPRMWGTGMESQSLVRPMAVHPHVCGEQRAKVPKFGKQGGSSPRMWGTELGFDPGPIDGRFIPTYVGNRMASLLKSRSLAVHPHVCGEQANAIRPL